MRIDGITLIQGSNISNLTVASGTSFPGSPDTGELFFRTDADENLKGLYCYIVDNWERIASTHGMTLPTGAVLPATAQSGDMFYLNTNDIYEGLHVYNDSAWVNLTGGAGPSFTITGDVTGTIDGGTDALTLATVNSSPGTVGGPASYVQLVVNGKGLVTEATEDDIAIDASQVVSGTFASARIAEASVTQHEAALELAASQVTSGTLADARVPQSAVTQHQAALTIAETQVTDGSVLARVGGNETITGNWTFNSPVVSAEPSAASHLTTKQYVDNALAGLSWKKPARVGTTANITLSGEQTIDGVAVVAGDRVLVKDQTAGEQNGVYVASASSWTRAADFDATSPIDEVNSAAVFVSQGTTQSDTGWTQTSPVTTIGTDPMVFVQFAASGTYFAGAGMSQSGNTFNVGTASSARIVVNVDDIDLATAGTPGTYTQVTTDAYGRVTSGANPTTLAGYGITDAQALDTTLTALAAFNTNGILTQTAADTFVGRSIAASGVGISITNGDGVAGNPTVVSNATPSNGASTIVSRDSAGDFSANIISATLNGNASTSSTVVGTQLGFTAHGTTTFATNADWSKPAGYQTFVTSASVSLPPSHGETYFGYTVTSKRDVGGGYSGLLTGSTGNSLWYTYTATDSTTPTWRKVLSDNNFNSYAPTLTGGGASGLWSINISGTAANTTSISSAVGTAYDWTASQNFISTQAVGVATQSGTLATYSTGGNPSTMSFHRGGFYAVNMGLDTDNVFRLGGWSDGASTYRLQSFPGGSLRIDGALYPSGGTRFLQNNTGTYGCMELGGGTSGNYYGIYLPSAGGTTFGMYDGGGNGGAYDTTTGWHFYWNRSQSCLGIGGSDTVAGYRARVNGAHYVDGNIFSGGSITASGDVYTNGVVRINTGDPTINFQDTDHRSGFIHVNSDLMYILRGAVNATTWDSGPNGRHPMTMNLATGNVTFSGDVTAFSDARLKKNVTTIDNALSKVLTLRGVTFDHVEQGRGTGLIAQEVQEVLPEAVHVTPGDEGYLTVAYGNTVGLLVEAIKELTAKVQVLEERLQRHESRAA